MLKHQFNNLWSVKKQSYFTVILFVTMNWLQFPGANMYAIKCVFKNLTLMGTSIHGQKSTYSAATNKDHHCLLITAATCLVRQKDLLRKPKANAHEGAAPEFFTSPLVWVFEFQVWFSGSALFDRQSFYTASLSLGYVYLQALTAWISSAKEKTDVTGLDLKEQSGLCDVWEGGFIFWRNKPLTVKQKNQKKLFGST